MFCVQTLFYPAISLKALSLWNCTAVGAHSYLTDDLSVPCSGPRYASASTFNAGFTIGVVVGWPSFILWYMQPVTSSFFLFWVLFSF